MREEARNVENKSIESQKGRMDYSLLIVIIFLVCFGLIMIYSTSSYEAQMKFNDASFYLKKQIFATAIGIVAMLAISRIDYHFWKRFAVVACFATIVCILLVKSPIGIEANGASRWIGVGPLSFQPAELAKLAVILFLAVYISKKRDRINEPKYYMTVAGLVLLVAGLIVIVTSNLSSAIIVLGIAFIMLFIASKNYKKYIFSVVIVAVVGGAVLFLVGGYRLQRIQVWLNPEAYAQDGGFQTLQALYAIGSGGLFGKGLGQSVQKLGFVPEAQNDMIFSIICEELGLFGGIAIIILFAFMIWRFVSIATKAPDLYGSLIVVGVMAHISLQVILNVAVVTNTIPNTGITLPFISYGGTSVLFLMAEMGLALSVSKGSNKLR